MSAIGDDTSATCRSRILLGTFRSLIYRHTIFKPVANLWKSGRSLMVLAEHAFGGEGREEVTRTEFLFQCS